MGRKARAIFLTHLLLLTVSTLLFLSSFSTVSASDGGQLTVISQPSTFTDVNNKWINEPNAWDWNNLTYAEETRERVTNDIYWSGFNTTNLGPITRVDLKIVVTLSGLSDDYVTIKYNVSAAEGTPWTSITSSVTQQVFSLENATEPNDGVWSWTDISNIKILQIGTQTKGPDSIVYRTHEVWIIIYYGQAPVASFTYTPEYPYTDETVTFNASDSYDPDGTVVSYFWDFGDGTNSTGEITTHSYADNGTYTVTLTVTDNDELSDIASADITVLNRPPVAIFTESAETVYTGETITFNASDSYDPDGTVVSYFWDFGDGTNATGVTSQHTYADNGNYTVTLTVTDNDGTTASANATKTVLNRPPVAVFTESAETVYTGEIIYFNASSSYDLDGSITIYFWDFGDGSNATGITAEHTYTEDGNYTVTLTITDDDGAIDTATSTKTVLNRPPIALFTESAETVYTGESIAFNASSSYDPDGTIISFFWDFGDGTNATGVIVDHSYVDNGSYTVALTVTDNDGATDTVTSIKTVLNRPPVASFTESAETVYTGETIYFNASASYDPDGTIVSYFWDFGDGTNATGVTVSHSYADNGTYTVTLTVTDDDGATATSSATKTVLNRPPLASFTESAETVLTSETIYFNASSSYDQDGSIISYIWDFGDGSNATGVIVEHAYADDGTYTVTLTVTDDDGAPDTTTSTKTVLNRPPVASFTESAETVYTSETITFNASASYDPDGIIVGYFWDFGDGTNATGVIVDHAYADDGVYIVTLTVTDDDGAPASTYATKTVLNRPPIAVFTESAETVYTNETIYFNASDSYDSDGSIVSYFWNFGDGTNASGVTVGHAYSDDGNYTVTLTVTDNDGATASTSASKTILNRPPLASFTESAETVYTDEPITFNASDSYDPDGTIVSYFWDFGDGTNATTAVVSHSYADNGTYTVTLTVTDDDGATASATATKTVLNRPPIAIFTESAETVYIGESITFNASDSYDPDGTIVSYFWDFGDGTNATGVIVSHAYSVNGTFTVTLTITDNDAASTSTSVTKTVLWNDPPIASFTESAEIVYTGETITFNASDSYDPDGSIVSYFWDFGDGTNATGVVVTHAYIDDGAYTVTLTVTDDVGATGSATAAKTVLNRPPTASFTESVETVLTGEVIYFNASDSYDPDGTIVNYFWDFGDGTNATGVTVSHAYTDNGNYTVTLTVTDDDGETTSATAVKTVLNRLPVASFTESATTVYTSEVIYFNASNSYDPDGYIVSYFWDFGDGTNATGVTATHAYADNGTYTVALTVTDDDGATATSSATKTVLNRPPLASFTESAETVYTSETIAFNASDSYDSDGVIVSYFWDLGDGTNATGVIVEHAYFEDGIYTVTLTVTDDDGATASTTATKTVLNRAPLASFTESATTVLTGETIYFNASDSYDPDGTIVSYFWDFGDGSNATGVTVNHAYANDGVYTVALTVTDNDGGIGTATATKTVLNRAPTATFTENATTVFTGEAIRFNASDSYDPDGTIVSYFWDFGDGTNATGEVVDHPYADDGTYTVTLTVTDDDGATATSSATKTVLNRPPLASFTESATTVYTGEVIYFNASESYDPDGTIISYFWDFSDGTNATGATVEHAYSDDGTYTVTLTVTDDDGATATATATKTVLNRPPVASFTESAETVYTSETITFNASNSYDPDGAIVSYFWDFGDGTNATGIIVDHAYVDDGVYTATLTVTDDDGASASASASKTVLNRPPVAVFTESATTVLTNEVITFNASASYDPDGSVVSYFWDFGDGANGSGVIVNHSYADDGTYTATLTVTDDDGATVSTSATKTVLNRPPVASFTESAETVYTGETIYFNASDSYDPDGIVVSFFWDFGDGTNATGVIVDHSYADDGNYTVTLIITDDDGATSSISSTKMVLNTPPVAIFTESAETVLTDETIYFNASASYDPDGTIVSYFWDFGDGSNATGIVVEHAYADDGNYTVTLTVTDDDGATDTASAVKTVLNRSPVALFTESAETVYTGKAIAFNASDSYDLDGSIVSYLWDFGDGANASGVIVTHSYADDGAYTVTLIVTDDDGAINAATSTKTVLNRPPVASFSESAETVLTGEVIYFNASASYDPDGYIVNYFWDFGDGTNATGVTVEHAYVDDGIYNVTFTVTDDDGATATATSTKTVLNRAPVASFTESAESVFTGEVITFNASASYDPDGSIVSFFWDFGDGTNASGVIVDHAYVDNGTYTVTLTVTDDDGATATDSSTKTVLNTPPVASFTESAETVYTGDVITLNASSSYDPDGVIVSYYWDFGDGTNATGVIVEHSYAEDGNYTVTLTVADDDGATGTATSTKTVLNRPPVVMFTESAETVYTSEVITFNASSSYDPDGSIISYFWDFGDGTNATEVVVSHAYADNGNYTVTLIVTDNDGATSSASAVKVVLNRPPIASFTETSETALTDEPIYFNASSSYDSDGTIVSYFWDFGDDTNATGITTQHAYADDGNYTVTLIVTDDDGATGTATSIKTILNRPPVATFTESAEVVYTGEIITFNASSSYDPDGTIATYFWDFGDSTNATGVTTQHAYADDGNYTVTLITTDDDGATASASATKTVLNRSPVATFTESATTVLTGEVIYFNASDSYDLDGSIVIYFWDFGDGTNATGVVIEHSYADDGNYTVTLTITDDDGATATATATKTVLNRPPVASFTESAETVYTGETITFNATDSYDPDGTIFSYFWDFGDGTNATGIVVTHAYADNGTYTVTLTATDDDGATATTASIKTVLNRPPVVSFTESAETVYTGEIIAFNASDSYDSDGSIVSYFWDFGDGTNATGVMVAHAYADDGNYTVTLTVTDDDGATGSTSATKTILNRPPVASFTESAETVYTGETITFNATDSYDSDGTIVGYFWDFGDGNNATGILVTHAYADNGTYTVTLIVTDDDGASSSTSVTKTVLNRPPVASFTESAETVYTSEIITFNASDSYDPDGYLVSYFWDFGDGTNATGVTVAHYYVDDGVYTVTLTVTDNDDATDTATATKTVLNRPPVAIFTESATTVLTNEVITFNASNSYDLDGSVVSYFWDFGDGTNGSGVIIDHAFIDDGVYNVTLTVTDDDGATDTAKASKTVVNRPPVAIFTESAETLYTGEAITFNASESYDPDGVVVSYYWDFGDGTNATGVVVEHAYIDDGNYTVNLWVTDDDASTDTASSTKIVLNTPPVALFTESAETVYTSDTITFNASESYDPDGTIVSYFWDFGDGTNATGVAVGHSYVDDGNYTVTLIVTDNDGTATSTSATKTVLNRPPVAIFTESAETVYTGEIITFDASDSYDLDGTIVGYFWDFGDGTNATGVTIGHAYADNGTYTVTLIITDDDGATATATSVKTILNRPPVATFTQSATVVYTGEIINFDASDSSDPDGVIVSYFWDFGDGTNATGVTVDHAYTDDGTYTVTLVVTDDDGATATATSTTKVLNRPPVAIFTESAEAVYTNEIIMFNASDSYDPDGIIVSYFWDFGDGTNATGVTVEHAYVEDGSYTVTLTVTDDDGATASTSSTKTILNRPPVASFTESAESVLVGETIYFNASSSYDQDGSIVSYFWDFGDGTNATGVTVEHAYNASGVFIVTLTVTDDDGATGTASVQKTVEVTPPVASFTESAVTVLTDEIIYFNASDSYDPDGTIVSYFWDFGDGTNATGVTAEHAYADNGNYTVTLTVTDNDGATDTATATKTVLNRPPIASFTESAETVYTGEIITFNASDSYDPDGIIISYFWDFGDGTNATGVTAEHAYAEEGNYTVTLTVTDDDDATATATSTKTILNRSPVATFTESATTVSTGTVIYFDASGSYDPDGVIVTYFWDFGDGTNATGITAEHAYADNGNYVVTLTVTDDDGATGTATATKTVLNRPPVASFTESAETVYTSEVITFNASSSYDPDGYIVSYFWDFGDGTNATGVVVDHAYADDGNYTVMLTVTDDDGATASTSATKTVLNRSPVALFTESAESVIVSETIYFNASSSYDPDGSIVSYFWDFGDGTNATGVTAEHAYNASGVFIVTLTVTDDDGATGTASVQKTVEVTPPVAIFTESAETVLTGETIYFNASDSYDPDGLIVEYFWDFGDGTNATGVTTEHAYADDGNYTVTLTVTDNDGATDTATSIKTILNKPPVASFTESAETVYTNEIITFNASQSYDLDGFIVSFFWNFGDGANATGVTAEHAYVDDGNYTVTLTVTDDDGASASASATKTVLNRPPVALFSESAETVYTDEVITLNASDSYDPDGTIVSFFWDFGDGNNATGMIVDHSYADDGNYTVILTVIDDDGATNSATSTKTILNRPPVAMFTESAESVLTGEVIYFNASGSYDTDGSIASYFWDFGDGTNASGVVVEHSYADDGTYTVTLTVTDNDGTGASTTATKTVLNRPPVAFFIESAETVYTGEVITFNASASYDPDGTIVGYFWDFGDGANATGVFVSHAYSDNGTYTVTLTVTDDDGAAASTSATKNILNRSPVASFTESAETVYTSEVMTFNASASYDPDGVIVTYFWDFGDGTNATGVIVEHAYGDDGNYTVTLTVTDDDGATDTVTSTKAVLNRSPVASFTESAETVLTGETIYLNASGSYDPDGTIVSYFWDFGDGINATGVTAEHAYEENGIYIVTLIVTDDDGSSATVASTKTVLNRSPVALFTESAATVLTGEPIQFNASSSYDSDGTIVSYFWDFGDGTNTTGVVVQHAYLENGVYYVTLTITDNDGAEVTANATKYVQNRSPFASFTYSPSFPIIGETVTFSASNSYDQDGFIVSYSWNFGDGNITTVTSPVIIHIYSAIGNYTTQLTVTDNDGASSTATQTVKVREYPIASFTYSPSFPIAGETMIFNASSSIPNGGVITSYLWDFGDGTSPVNTTNPIVTHVYSTFGNYTITLTVADSEDLTDTTTDTIQVKDYPTASFTFSPDYPIEKEAVTFDATASNPNGGVITGYEWNFGDGNVTLVSTPTVVHVYSAIGNYTVTLTITDSEGLSDSESKIVSIRGYPIATFTYTPTAPYVGDTLTFDASLSTPNGGAIINYSWDFGDGSPFLNTTDPLTTHIYSVVGNFTVTLTVSDSEGLSDTEMHSVVVAKAPVAAFMYSPEFPNVGETVTFNASESYDPNGYIASYTWDFGDGNATTVTTPTVTHVYTETGIYTVMLTVTDDDGYTDTASGTVTLGTPKASFTFTPEHPIVDQSITFNASSSSDPNGYIVSYVWNFGDGNITSMTDPTITHVYTASGNYTITLTVADNQGLTDTTTKVVSVGNAPEASFTYTPSTPYVGDTVTFDASSSTPSSGNITSYVWNFGDGSPTFNTTDPITTHLYETAGNYTVSLTITDTAELSNTAKKIITIKQSPVAAFTYSPTYPEAFDIVTFNASDSYDVNGYIVSYVWNFGDGNITTVTNPIITHVYDSAGNYTVVLIVADNEGYTHSTSKKLYVSLRPPVADFTYTPDFPVTDQSITFNASNSYDLDGSVVSYTWDFGDGNTTTITDSVITHQFYAAGNYTVTLTVTDNDNLAATKTSIVRVRDYPTASFTYTPINPGVGGTVTFNASSSVPNGGVMLYYLWDFGDGSPPTNTTDTSVTYAFNASGNYTVTLTVVDSEELSDTTSKTLYVSEWPIASFTYSPSEPYVGDTVTFNASQSYDPDGYIVSHLWDFGEGSPKINSTDPTTTYIYNTGGNFTVTLAVTDNLGLTGTVTLIISVGKAPAAVFTYTPDFPVAGETVTFNASGSYDIRRPIANYTWNFGDGNITTVTTAIITRKYVKEGNYTVLLKVTDIEGYEDTTTQIVEVRNYPIASFSYTPSYPIKGEETTFDASSSQPRGGVIVSYLWDFGDGTSQINTTNPIAKHVFMAVGEYNVTLTVTDSEGLTSTVSKTLKVRDYPTADFTWSPTYPIATYPVTFNASLSKANSGVITGYGWNFGDGNVTTVTTPTIIHVYSSAGNYTVKLTVTNSEGLSSSITKTVGVLNAPPIADFDYFPSFPIMNQTTTFDASASYDPDGNITSYVWNFGDGNITSSSEPVVYHVYASSGNFTATLTVTDNVGQNTSISKEVRVGQLPVASFAYSPTSPYVGDEIVFNASQSYDPNGYIVSYLWDFGDGSPLLNQTSPTATHIYSQGGNYTVLLTVTDSEGLTASATQIVNVAKAPVAIFYYSPSYPIVGDPVTVNASESYDDPRTIVSYFWDFGDGYKVTTSSPLATYVYLQEGNYTITLTVTDDRGYSDVTGRPINIRNYPAAAFTLSPKSPIREETVTFNASTSSARGGSITSYLWDFGDGSLTVNTTSSTVTHTYTVYGNYTVTLIVTDSEGLNGSALQLVTVREYPAASYAYSPSPAIPRNVTATFNATSSQPKGGMITSYTWDFGDGNVTTVTTPIITHAFMTTGIFQVKLTVIDSENLSGTITKDIWVIPAYPVASFTVTPKNPIKGEVATFDASESYDPDGWIASYRWDFGDGSTTTLTSSVAYHTYSAIGFYNVTLTVTDYDGYQSSVTKVVEVITYPTAIFTWAPYYPQEYNPATFNASASTPGSGVIVSYVWDFGDGNVTTVTQPMVTHTFGSFGSYTVTLTVVNNGGLSRSRAETISVVGVPVANFTWKPIIPTVNQTVTFNASSSQPRADYIVTYQWDFGDGTPPITVRYNPIVTHQYATYGEYMVTLSVTNTGGLTDTTYKTLTVISPPTAEFAWAPQSPYAYDMVTFNASASTPNGANITGYIWDFGDGNVTATTDPIVKHSFVAGGNYTVTLNVTSSNGLSDTASYVISVAAATSPLANFTSYPSTPGVFEQVIFNASASEPRGGEIITYIWNFGDGNITIADTPLITHSYQVSGNFTVALNVTNTAGLWSVVQEQIQVKPISGPTARFTWLPTLPYLNSTVTFNASDSTSGWNGTIHAPIVSYMWDFGDGNITAVSTSTISHVYSEMGNYTVTLTVIDLNGATGNQTKIIKITGLLGDINGDGEVDIRDVSIVARAYGSYPGAPNWNPDADLNGDGEVDIRDVSIVARQYGKSLSTMSLSTLRIDAQVFPLHLIVGVVTLLSLLSVMTNKILVKWRKKLLSIAGKLIHLSRRDRIDCICEVYIELENIKRYEKILLVSKSII